MDRARAALADRAEAPAWSALAHSDLAHSDFGPQKHSSRLWNQEQCPAERIVPNLLRRSKSAPFEKNVSTAEPLVGVSSRERSARDFLPAPFDVLTQPPQVQLQTMPIFCNPTQIPQRRMSSGGRRRQAVRRAAAR